jgi:hypothetical protein
MTFPWDGSGRTSEDTSTNDRGIHIWHDADDNPEDVSVQSTTVTLENVTILSAIVLAMSWMGNRWDCISVYLV